MEEGRVLYEGQVEVAVGWSADRVARCGADGELGSDCEGSGVEEARWRAIT